ncbi:MAG: alpha-L-fucosidase, partial [Planctomycetota bacterium]
MLNNHFFSGKTFQIAVVLISLVVSAQLLAQEAQPETIKAKEIAANCELQASEAVDIKLADYWRSNIVIGTEGVLGSQKNPYASHVPGLVEYKIDLPIGGEFEIQAKYKASKASPTYLDVDGECLGIIFEKAGNFQGEYKSLSKFKARKGKIKLRFTSQYVETPFPVVSVLRVVYLGGEAPPAKLKPKTVGYRKKLAKDWYKTISRKIHCDFHTGGFIKGIGKNFDADEYSETLKNNGINSIAIFAKGHHGYAYYNTKIGTRHPGLDFDLMKAQVDACHKKGIAVWVYLSIALDEIYGSTTEHTKVEKNVEWRHFQRVNANVDTPYITEYTWPMVVECVRDYDIDGFFFDFPG